MARISEMCAYIIARDFWNQSNRDEKLMWLEDIYGNNFEYIENHGFEDLLYEMQEDLKMYAYKFARIRYRCMTCGSKVKEVPAYDYWGVHILTNFRCENKECNMWVGEWESDLDDHIETTYTIGPTVLREIKTSWGWGIRVVKEEEKIDIKQ